MNTDTLLINNSEIKYSILKDANNNWAQFFYSIIPSRAESIGNQIKTIEQAELALYKTCDIDNGTAVFKRFFSSDLMTHCNDILSYKERQPTDFFMSLTEQPPATNVKLSLLGMCLNNIKPGSKRRENNVFSFDTLMDVKHVFFEQITDPVADEQSDAETQTRNIFDYLQKKLKEFNATIEDNVLRTWLYAPHVDADYPGIVKARKELFDSINLTKETHYIASTGIQGGSGNRFARVSMDVYATVGVNQEKIRYIQAPEYLSPTHVYGVTFERATAARLGKSDFLFISGTASIDKKGDILHLGDVEKQTVRTLENIDALLDAGNFRRDDLTSFIVYLRDPSDYVFVKLIIDKYCINLPTVYLKASVCRPGWLIEIEATGAKII